SVSRVGGDAQIKAMKTVAGSLRLDLSQYRELEAFAAFGSDLDPTSKATLERGARLVELLKQGPFSPMPVAEQVVSIYAGTRGHLDTVPVEDVRRFEAELLDYLRHHDEGVLAELRDQRKLTEDVEQRVIAAINKFKEGFTTSDGRLVVNEPVPDAMA